MRVLQVVVGLLLIAISVGLMYLWWHGMYTATGWIGPEFQKGMNENDMRCMPARHRGDCEDLGLAFLGLIWLVAWCVQAYVTFGSFIRGINLIRG